MTRLQCPRCEQTIDAPATGDPVCPHCGFTAPYESEQGQPLPAEPVAADPQPFGGPSPGSIPPPGPAQPTQYGGYAGAHPAQPHHPAQGVHPGVATTRTSAMAVTSLIMGLVGVCFVFIIWVPLLGWISFGPAVLAVIFGGLGIAEANRDPGVGGRGLAVAGLVLGIIIAAIGLIFRVIFMGL